KRQDAPWGPRRGVGRAAEDRAGGPGEDGRACPPAPREMSVVVSLKIHMARLLCDAPRRSRALVAFGPFAADHDHAVTEPHLGMELVGAIDAAPPHDEHGRFEAEGVFEPL